MKMNSNIENEMSLRNKTIHFLKFKKIRILIFFLTIFLYILLYFISLNTFSYYLLIPRHFFNKFIFYGFFFVIINISFLIGNIIFFYIKYYEENLDFYFNRPFTTIYSFIGWTIFHLISVFFFYGSYLISQDISYLVLSILVSLYIGINIINQFALNNTFYLRNIGKIMHFSTFSEEKLIKKELKRRKEYTIFIRKNVRTSARITKILERYFEEFNLNIINQKEIENNFIHYFLNLAKNSKLFDDLKKIFDGNINDNSIIPFQEILSIFQNNLGSEIKLEVNTAERWLKKKVKVLGSVRNLSGIIPTIITISTFILTFF